ncbi:hypothetical protein FBD94_25750 [Pedobacter hiemivivus]|uniref:DUF695 domain-containing protein n=1 Tax=Pedobacter hiemivivus TaxID=2530454 RepID=A0A4U1FWC4_9SPHI|nr:hypothetical protein [Pedobacter hiemivivus]TKC54874.1 hypothetical protein FBD94_25750 [Pedobacter hiemivivus]
MGISQVSKEKQFWNWFELNNAKYFFLNQIDDNKEKERYLDEFLKQLHEYDNHLFFEIGGYPDETQELIITAEGNLEYFEKVEKLINSAPYIKNWSITAFKPAIKAGFTINYKDIELNPKDLWFFPLEKKQAPQLLGLRIYLENYKLLQRKDELLKAVYLVIDSLLGEKSSALDIQHVEVAQLPEDPEKQGLLKLDELPKYIQWKKNNR